MELCGRAAREGEMIVLDNGPNLHMPTLTLVTPEVLVSGYPSTLRSS